MPSEPPSKLKEAYYYLRDESNRPIITRCIMFDGMYFTRGTAVCSREDQACKKTGRKIARDKCHKALGTQKTSCQISRARAIFALADAGVPISGNTGIKIRYKSEFGVGPQNDLEKKIFEKLKEIKQSVV